MLLITGNHLYSSGIKVFFRIILLLLTIQVLLNFGMGEVVHVLVWDTWTVRAYFSRFFKVIDFPDLVY